MSARRAVGMLCALGACLWMGRVAIGEEQPVELFAAPGLDVIDVSYNAPEKAGATSPNAAHSDSGQCSNCAYGDCCQPVWRWTAGVEATYLDVALRGLQNIGMNAGPRIWVGAENCNGWGARASYWDIGATEFFVNQPLASSPSATDTFDQLFHLNLYTIDVEATKRGEWGDWDWLAFFGGRYASYSNQVVTDIADTAPVTNDVFVDNIHAQVGGFTTGIEGSRPLGWGPLEVYAGGRVSVLWGDADNFHVARLNVSGVQTTQLIGSSIIEDLTIWEAQIGLQCSKYIACCKGTVFSRVGFEYQAWNFTNTNSINVPIHDLDLYGVAVSVGCTR